VFLPRVILAWLVIAWGTAAPSARAVDIEALLAGMTLDEKIGQMTQAERDSATPNDVRDYFLGSILSGGGSAPASNTPTGWADLHDAYQNAALGTRLGIPMIYGIDAVHGHNNVIGATIFPHNIGLGAARDPVLIEEIGRLTAKEVRCTGLEWTFAPCVAVVRDERWGRTYEGFGEDPALQSLLAGSYVRGFQGTTMQGERVIACAKHYVGDGGTSGGIDRGDTVVDEATLRAVHLPGFVEAINQNVGTIMPSYSSWNGVKLHQHAYLLTDVLKTELGFDGFLISDWDAVYELSGPTFYDQVVQMTNAGVDMAMMPNNWRDWITTLKSAVNNGDVSMTRIDDAVRRILRVKDRAGVFDAPLADRGLVNSNAVGSSAHRAVARAAVRKSLVLLKNDGVLPLAKNLNVFVAGKSADNLGYQCGGWTISWQGASGNTTIGTTVLQAIESVVGAHGGTVTFDEAGFGSAGHDVAIAVVGETPYAEGFGDDNVLALDATDLACLNRIDDIPTIVILISGRPLMIRDQLDEWDAFVAAWLPGTEGDGVADVLFGDHDFTGKLSHSWPIAIEQVPINVGDGTYRPLFAYGYGLDYGAVAPTVTFSDPVDGATVPAGNVTLSATATDADGAIAKVEFYAGTDFIGEAATAPYTVVWSAAPEGSHTLTARAIDDIGNVGVDTIAVTLGDGGGGQLPFNGSPATLPGLIQAEDYDLGGTGVAYQDADAGNNGGQYRPLEDVDIEVCTDTGGGHNVGWMANGEWLEYTVNVAAPGEYQLAARVASQTTGGVFHLEFDGVDATGSLLVPVTGDWQSWTTVSTLVELSAGTQIMRFANDSLADEYNVNSYAFTLVHPLGDIDRDGDLDLADFMALTDCLAGPNVTTPPAGCAPGTFDASDLDDDGDVDAQDYARFQEYAGF
jgi:beta-glucosidase